MAVIEVVNVIVWQVVPLFIMLTVANFSICNPNAESATLATMLLQKWETEESPHLTNRKQKKGSNRVLIGPRARRKYWRMESGNREAVIGHTPALQR